VAGLRLVAESTGGRRNRIDTLLVCRVPERADDEPARTGSGEGDGAGSGATRADQPAAVVEG
jgi:hypothetical protein